MNRLSDDIRKLSLKLSADRFLVFLGTGPSDPIVERSGKDNRKNTSVLIYSNGIRFLIDIPPDFDDRIEFDYLLTSHHHQDAFGGFSIISNRTFIYAVPQALLKGLGTGPWKVKVLKENSKTKLGNVDVIAFPLIHSFSPEFPTFGYQFIFQDGYKLVYASDMVKIPEESEKFFDGVDMALVDGAGWEYNLPTHFGIIPFLKLEKKKKWNIKRIFFVQIGRLVPTFNEANKKIKSINKRAELSFDGQKVFF